MINLSASLLGADFARMGEAVQRAEQAGVDSFHLDITDGYFVPSLSLSAYHVRALRPYTHLPFTLHLEVQDSFQILKSFEDVEVDTIIIMANPCRDIGEMLRLIRARGAKAGLSIFPDETIEGVLPWLDQVDIFLLLAVWAGYCGQVHDPNTPEKAHRARSILNQINPLASLTVDGGVNLSNAAPLISAGVDEFVVGSALFNASDMTDVVKTFKSIERPF